MSPTERSPHPYPSRGGRARARARGFTLIELMVAILVSSIVLMGVFAFASIQKDTASLQQRQVTLQQALEGSMHSLGTDVRMAGLGFGRTCSEVRIWSAEEGRLINPGAVDGVDVANAFVDGITGEPYWVLRDGVQAHWRSGPDVGANDMAGAQATSASPSSAADSLDVFRGELNIASGSGPFIVQELPGASAADATLTFQSSSLVDNADALQLAAVRQMFAPGSFVLLAPLAGEHSYITETQAQCVLLQITDEVEPGLDNTSWRLPVSNDSGFNDNLETLLSIGAAVPSDASVDAVNGKTGAPFGADWIELDDYPRVDLIPLGRARWSRYEIDYTAPTRPMLVRSDIIGWRDGDPTIGVSDNYPGCTGNLCRAPRLYLPSNNVQPPRVAIGPMIEDMQVAVGCDGWSVNTPPVNEGLMPPPDPGFEELGPASGPLANTPNRKVDERAGDDDDRGNDEWLGNATQENWGPDCVSWGTAERNAAEWAASGPGFESEDAPGFRMTPHIVRVTLLAKPDTLASGSDAAVDDFYNPIVAIEDRPTMSSIIGGREYRTLTERFQVRNSHWRDPAVQ